MALNDRRPDLDERIRKLHAGLIEATGGPPQGGEIRDPYWATDSQAFQKFFGAVLGESSHDDPHRTDEAPPDPVRKTRAATSSAAPEPAAAQREG
jgi:hypothetical protein